MGFQAKTRVRAPWKRLESLVRRCAHDPEQLRCCRYLLACGPRSPRALAARSRAHGRVPGHSRGRSHRAFVPVLHRCGRHLPLRCGCGACGIPVHGSPEDHARAARRGALPGFHRRRRKRHAACALARACQGREGHRHGGCGGELPGGHLGCARYFRRSRHPARSHHLRAERRDA